MARQSLWRAAGRLLLCLPVAACGNSLTQSQVPTTVGTSPPGTVQGRVSGTDLVAVQVDGMNRICSYRSGPVSTQLRIYRVGLAQQCPRNFPTADRNFPVPPTAMLESSSVDVRGRQCIYAQGSGRWTITVAVTEACPRNAGTAQQNEARAEAAQAR